MAIDGKQPAVPGRKRSRPAASASISDPTTGSTSVPPPSESAAAHWTFLTNHTHVLALLSKNPNLVLREVALQVRITERAVQRIIADLEAAGVIEREKIGRQNRYKIRTDQPLRHPVYSHRTIGELLTLINGVEK